MKLNINLLYENKWLIDRKIETPKYDVLKVKSNTKENPKWVHFGAGNIFRGFIANAQNSILNKGLDNSGIIAVESYDFDIINKIYKNHDNLTLLSTMKHDGLLKNSVIGSVVESYTTQCNYDQLVSIFEKDTLQLVSFTITEKGYVVKTVSGELIDLVRDDIISGFNKPKHVMSVLVSLLYKRYQSGNKPISIVSMDNCSLNGDVLKESVLAIAQEWSKSNDEMGFLNYLNDEEVVAFPLSMIDKITPRPSINVQNKLEKIGFVDINPIVTSKNTYIAPFVNAESCEYLVIEDRFPNGRPKLERAGILFADRKTVNQVETMKVTTCLNPLHTALAVSGCLLGYTLIADQMKDELLNTFVKRIGYDEGLKVVVDPKVINPKSFLDEVVNERLMNPNIPDTPQRIATDTSQKIGIRFGETIKSYDEEKDLDPKDLIAIPLAIATWLRYLLGIDDQGNHFEISPDPLIDVLTSKLKGIEIGKENNVNIYEILSDKSIFRVNLYEVGLGKRIEEMFEKMLKGPNSVRDTLNEYLYQ